MDKPSVYLDTTIVSAYWYDGADLASFARRLKTRQWWDHEREHFSVWASGVTEKELRAGEFRRQDDCVDTAHGMDYLLTWNYAHLANPVAQRQLEVFCDAHELRAPLLVSPESIRSVRMGGIIRRRD